MRRRALPGASSRGGPGHRVPRPVALWTGSARPPAPPSPAAACGTAPLAASWVWATGFAREVMVRGAPALHRTPLVLGCRGMVSHRYQRSFEACVYVCAREWRTIVSHFGSVLLGVGSCRPRDGCGLAGWQYAYMWALALTCVGRPCSPRGQNRIDAVSACRLVALLSAWLPHVLVCRSEFGPRTRFGEIAFGPGSCSVDRWVVLAPTQMSGALRTEVP